MPDASVEEIEVRLLLEAIHARYGYDLRSYAFASMRRRVRAAVVRFGMQNLGELQHRVLHDAELFARLLGELTVPVSEMFRDPTFFLAFRARVVPLLRTYPRIKIWHCGCATGEEVFATAILLTEEDLYDRATIFATDLSPRALELAAQGIYDASRAPRFGQNYVSAGGTATLDRYYTAAYDRISLRDSLTKNVVFFQHDLVSDHVFAEMNVVFCRNVLIYFNPPLRDRVLEKIAQSLRPGGFLCLGSSERLTATGVGALFTEVDRAQRIYRLAA